MIRASLRHGFANLLRFDGRDSPRLFWPHALILLVIACAAWSIVVFAGTPWIAVTPRTIAVQDAGMRVEASGAGVPVLPDFAFLMVALGLIAGLYVALVGAAAVRRLHDADRRGWWLSVPVALLAVGLVAMHRMFVRFAEAGELPDFDSFALIFVNNLVYLVTLAALFVQLVRPGTPGPNRFGPPGA